MKVTTKCNYLEICGNHKKCDEIMDGRADGWVGLFLLWWGTNDYSSH